MLEGLQLGIEPIRDVQGSQRGCFKIGLGRLIKYDYNGLINGIERSQSHEDSDCL